MHSSASVNSTARERFCSSSFEDQTRDSETPRRKPRIRFRSQIVSLLLTTLVATLPGPIAASAAIATLAPLLDNTLFESPEFAASNGSGGALFAGLTGANAGFLKRRALLQFDLSSIPTDALLTSVTLTLYADRTALNPTQPLMAVHRTLSSWGEGASSTLLGAGATAKVGDATWDTRFFGLPGQEWASPGGDFVAQASATARVGFANSFNSWTDAGLLVDVTSWMANPASNFGWTLVGDEVTATSAIRFVSREGIDPNLRPQLVISYDPVPEPSALALLLLPLLALSSRRWTSGLRPVGALAIILVTALPESSHAEGPIAAPIIQGDIQVQLQPVATGLVSPLNLVEAPDGTGRKMIVEQKGQVQILQNGSLSSTPFLDLSSRMVALSPGYDERGLLGFAFDPGFADPSSPGYGRVFTYTSEPVASGTPDFLPPIGDDGSTALNHHSVIASWRVNASNPNVIDPASRQELLRFGQPQSNHNGGCLAFGPDGMLYIGSGDGGGANDGGGTSNRTGHNSAIGNGQDNGTLLGKVLRIDVNGANSANGRYGIPATNPFSGGISGAKEIYAVGLRNPYRFSFDGTDLYVGDVGQNNVEELDRVVVGGDYGWAYKEGTFRFDRTNGSVSTDLTGLPTDLLNPILQYDHDEGISITAGFVYRGSLLPELYGKYVFGDFARSFSTANGRLLYADLSTFEIREFTLGPQGTGLFLKGFGQDANGELYVMGSTTLGPSGTTGVAMMIVPESGAGALLLATAALIPLRRRRGC